MAEYISREDVLKKAKSSILLPADNEWDCGYNTAMAEMRDFIKQLPAADVQPVKRGHWIDHEKFERKNCNVCIECSVCNTWFGHDCIPKTKFCPNCGADLRRWENG